GSALGLVVRVVEDIAGRGLATGKCTDFRTAQRAGVDREIVQRTIECRVGAVLGLAQVVAARRIAQVRRRNRDLVVGVHRLAVDVEGACGTGDRDGYVDRKSDGSGKRLGL